MTTSIAIASVSIKTAISLEPETFGGLDRSVVIESSDANEIVTDANGYFLSPPTSTAISQVLGSALAGRCKDRPDFVEIPLPLEVIIEVLPVKGGEDFLRSIFEPLGYNVEAQQRVLDEQFPEWGDSPYFSVKLSAEVTHSALLNHLYIFIPVFDNQKHYFAGPDELDKLLAKGEGWLSSHPEKEAIARRYLRFQPSLVRPATRRSHGGDTHIGC